ncbi:MAG: G1 family glutamic endopeptidase [Solirubrobacteraceae bacterium]
MNRRALGLAVVVLAVLAGAPAAFADSTQSSNWAGYAVHRSGVRFSSVSGTWTQPRATCSGGRPTYSSVWVGLGGYRVNSPALEQIGTEADCTASGRAVSSAWYELVPQASRTIGLTVNSGDRMRANVTVKGSEVWVTLANLTRHRSFTKRMHASTFDTASAEWILEAPSVCARAAGCQTLPLANFGSAGFTSAVAVAATGHRGTITDRRWTTTKIMLGATGRQFVSDAAASTATATPSALAANGSAFSLTYGPAAAPTAPIPAGRAVSDQLARPELSPTS